MRSTMSSIVEINRDAGGSWQSASVRNSHGGDLPIVRQCKNYVAMPVAILAATNQRTVAVCKVSLIEGAFSSCFSLSTQRIRTMLEENKIPLSRV